ncbi:MAG: L-histidine N(alpha)-methyltransferase [Pirellulaceae bacterium]
MPHSNACSSSILIAPAPPTSLAISSEEAVRSSLESFRRDVLQGLSQSKRQLPCKYFYDRRGSLLFDQICELPEYYPTRTEAGIMADNVDAIARRIGSDAVIVEYGSGSSTKTRLLLDHLVQPHAYVPVDISREHLLQTANKLREDYPHIDIHPVVADFTAPFSLPHPFRRTIKRRTGGSDALHSESSPGVASDSASCNTVYFPGSTIGNLEPDAAVVLLQSIADQCQPGGGLLIGFDLKKNPDILQAAYDDSQGVTAQFNLNLLHRMNRELDAEVDVDQFRHVAVYNDAMSRIEIYIESCIDQSVRIENSTFQFDAGDRILTEYSHKYDIETFTSMAELAGLVPDEVWTDADDYFAIMHLSAR